MQDVLLIGKSKMVFWRVLYPTDVSAKVVTPKARKTI